MFANIPVAVKVSVTAALGVLPVLAAWISNAATGLLVLGVITFLITVVIWRQNRRGFARIEKLLLDKAREGQKAIEILDPRPK